MYFWLRSIWFLFCSSSHFSAPLNRQRRLSIPVRSAMGSLLLSHTSSTGFPGKCWHLFLSFLEVHVTKVQAKVRQRVKLGKWAGQHVRWSGCERGAPAVGLHAVLQFHSKEALGNPQQCLFLPPYPYTRRTNFSPSPCGFWGVNKADTENIFWNFNIVQVEWWTGV